MDAVGWRYDTARTLGAQERVLEREIGNLTQALATGAAPTSVLEAFAEREVRLKALRSAREPLGSRTNDPR